jgi:hypothetical protein
MSRARVTTALLLAAALGAAATLALAASRSNAPAARAEAKRLLRELRLPPGATRVSHRPAGELTFAPSVPSVPGLVDLHGFFSVPGTPSEVIAWVGAHRPRGASQGDSGSDGSGGTWTSFELGPVARVIAVRDLVIDAVPIGSGRSAVRVDAQTAPLPVLPGRGAGPGSLRVVESGTIFGSIGFALRCNPSGGTVPRPAHVCAAIRRTPALLYSSPGPAHSCPPSGSISLSGTWNHRPLHSTFSVCTGGQEQQAGEWFSLLPSPAAQATVAVDRGIGLVRLGEAERSVLDLLRGLHAAPAWCAGCARTFRANFAIGYGTAQPVPEAVTVRFAAGRVSAVESNAPLTVQGNAAQRGFGPLSRALRGWRTVTCGTIRELVHSSANRSTAIVYGSWYQRVTVTTGPAGCPAAAAAA